MGHRDGARPVLPLGLELSEGVKRGAEVRSRVSEKVLDSPGLEQLQVGLRCVLDLDSYLAAFRHGGFRVRPVPLAAEPRSRDRENRLRCPLTTLLVLLMRRNLSTCAGHPSGPWVRSYSKGQELANRCSKNIDELDTAVRGGMGRVGKSQSLPFSFLKHAGLFF